MADGRTVEIPHAEFAMISGWGRIFYVAKPDSDLFEAFDSESVRELMYSGPPA